MDKIIRKLLFINLLLCMFIISGCSNRPYLTGDNNYSINTVKITGEIQKEPLKIPWNFNMAVMRNLLMESSFVLSDLHTLDPDDFLEPSEDTVYLESIFPESQNMTLIIDDQPVELDINSIQIEVKGSNIGKIILNQTIVFQGINNPNLEPAFNDFAKELKKKESSSAAKLSSQETEASSQNERTSENN